MGLVARIIQHEYDHIEGILFIDHLNPLKRRLLKGKLEDVSKGKVDVNYKMKFQNLKKVKRIILLLVVFLVFGCNNEQKELINTSPSKSYLEELRINKPTTY